MRSFWSDLEKNNTSPPTPYRASPTNRSSKIFENNIFIQSDKNSPTSQSSESPHQLQSEQHNQQFDKSALPSKRLEDDLVKKSNLARNGSLSRLQGPRQFTPEPQQLQNHSPSRLKKMVTFNNSAQVIQYESVTPDMSASNDSINQWANNGDFEEGEEEEEEEEDDNSLDVPIIDPSQFNSSPVRVPSRPLPSIPNQLPLDDENVEEEEEGGEYTDQENQLPVESPGGSFQDYTEDEDDEPTCSLTDPRPLPSESDMQHSPELSRHESLSDSERKIETRHLVSSPKEGPHPQRSMSERRKSLDAVLEQGSRNEMGEAIDFHLDDEDLNRYNGALVEKQEEDDDDDNDTATQSSLDDKNEFEFEDANSHFSKNPSKPDANENSSTEQISGAPEYLSLAPGIEHDVENNDNTASTNNNNDNGDRIASESSQSQYDDYDGYGGYDDYDNETNETSQSITLPNIVETNGSTNDSDSMINAPVDDSDGRDERSKSPEEERQDEELQQQLDQLDLGDLDYNQDKPLMNEEGDDSGLERSDTVIHRPERRKISPHLYYEQDEELPQVSYRGQRNFTPSPSPEHTGRQLSPPSIPVPQIPRSTANRQPTPPIPALLPEPEQTCQSQHPLQNELSQEGGELTSVPEPEIKQEPIEQFQGLPEVQQTTPLTYDEGFIKDEPIDEYEQYQLLLEQQKQQEDELREKEQQLMETEQQRQEQSQQPQQQQQQQQQRPPTPPSDTQTQNGQPQQQEQVHIKQEYESPVPSLNHSYSPNSMDSPVKTERPSPEDEWTQFYNNGSSALHTGFNIPRMNEFANELSSFDQERDFSLREQFDDVTIKSERQNSQSFEREIKTEPKEDDVSAGQFDDEKENEPEQNQNQNRQENSDNDDMGESTIRASSGSKLKTRPSLTPLDVRRISNSRRASSGGKKKDQEVHDHVMQEINRVPVPMLQLSDYEVSESGSMFGDLDEQFDKLLQNGKRGYTLRQNESMVVATERKLSGGNRASRKVSGALKKVPDTSFSNTLAPTPELEVTNDEINADLSLQAEEGDASNTNGIVKPKEHDMPDADKGRLFVRVVSIKDIDLPDIDSKKGKFSLTLDNGIHCITTQQKPLKKTSMLDQEFELTVGNELEFILTINAKWPKPAQPPVQRPTSRYIPPPPPPPQKEEKKHRHGLAKLFGSPKKKNQPSPSPNPIKQFPQLQPAPSIPEPKKDSWDNLVATDGSFGRSYVAFSQYQKEVYGRPATFEIPCFNEWATYSNKSKKQPYKVAKLQVQMMYIPRASRHETLPKNIKEALDELREARKDEPVSMEGCLSQLGGDCRYWRRRMFRLEGTMLTAYSETSGKPRATINLSKAVRVIDDKGSLTQPVVQVGKNRRKSAFAQQEEGFMFVNEAFRIRFKNNEIIDFYADSSDIKKEWTNALLKVIGSAPSRNPWTDLVMRRVEEQE